MPIIERQVDVIVNVETTLTEDELESLLDAAFDGIKVIIRNVISADNISRSGESGRPSQIKSWHVERFTGSTDEIEP